MSNGNGWKILGVLVGGATAVTVAAVAGATITSGSSEKTKRKQLEVDETRAGNRIYYENCRVRV